MLGFIFGHDVGFQPATVAMLGAALLLVLHCLPHEQEKQSKLVHESLCEVEWITIFFFIGLFIVVYGVESTGLMEIVAQKVIKP